MENKAMKFNPNLSVEVELSFDEPKTGDNQYGTWYLYGTKENIKGESGFFATQILHEILQGMGAKTGSKLIITKVVNDNKTTWDVKPVDGGKVEEKSITDVISNVASSMDANKPNEVKELSLEEKVNIMWDKFNKGKDKKTANVADDLPF
tara:strand:+ start:418 stop:867 length:450 start_codon:yes stop_codon:yes gene_type:complete